jgi:3-hydroxybutyryl-CoA dehydrogenase
MRIGVIGAGAQGRAFAAACARAGHAVVLEDVMPHKLRQAGLELASLGADVRFAATVEDAVSDADFVVDFVPDELESKLEIWALLDRMAPPRTVLCTPSELLSITDLASCTYRADRCVMVRGALDQTARTRVLAAMATSAATVDLTRQLFVSLAREVSLEADPDLPQLLKNMHAAAL